MADPTDETAAPPRDLGMRLALILGFLLVCLGMLNSMPAIPGLQQLVNAVTGVEGLPIRRFSYEYLFPLAFIIMISSSCRAIRNGAITATAARGSGLSASSWTRRCWSWPSPSPSPT